MSQSDFPARGNVDPEPISVASPGSEHDALADTNGGSGAGVERPGRTARADAADSKTGANGSETTAEQRAGSTTLDGTMEHDTGVSADTDSDRPTDEPEYDEVTEASMESFPASDPPAY